MQYGIYFANSFSIMKIHIIHTLISAMVFWGVYGPAAALSAEDDQYFLDRINEIRTAPYNYAIEHLECTPDFLKAKGIKPDTTFARYTLDERLTAMAEDESQLMAGEEITVSEAPPYYRLTASTGGVVSFFNFMSREEAFIIVINYLFKKELDNESFDHILSKDYSSAGIAISAGKVGSGNAWFVAICLRSAELVSEIQMLNLINDVRSNPNNIWTYEYNGTKMNQADVFSLNSGICDLFAGKYEPLFFNADLSVSASQAETDPETGNCHGYEGEVVRSEVAIRSEEEWSQPVEFLFFSLLFQELASWPQGLVVFSNGIQDVGSSSTFQPGDGDGEIGFSILSFVVGKSNLNAGNNESAGSEDATTVRIYGLLFSDIDGKGLYAPGYELIKQTVKVYDDEMQEQEIQSAVTDNAGHFFMELPANQQYYFTATIDGVPVSWEGNDGNYLITTDQFVKLTHTPTPDVP
ncbi:hypothetical protein DespoDRAFT_01455 [Desulfobacter postgatei 2ac9]|uniref:Uncharacterized protein n=2 Tax=Desulfobacter postgatei TaxID=2293 RepID=I5B1N6_9BACT|nr:hypothetical protein DespoDRAFT_01455 [Desulfobacter postgatei 2ac9]